MSWQELVLYCPYNTPGRNPATGRVWRDGDEFVSEAIAYKEFHGRVPTLLAVDNRKGHVPRLERVLSILTPKEIPERRIDALTVFCHGLKTGLQIGVDMSNLQEFCEALSVVSRPLIAVTLYACSAGADADLDVADEKAAGPGGEGGFADCLRDMLRVEYGVHARVLAHATRGHCSRNPYAREFLSTDTFGGNWLVDPTSELWPRWRHALEGELRFRLPRLSKEEIHAALRV